MPNYTNGIYCFILKWQLSSHGLRFMDLNEERKIVIDSKISFCGFTGIKNCFKHCKYHVEPQKCSLNEFILVKEDM